MGFEPVGLESAVSSALDAVYEMVEARGRWGFGIREFGTDEPGADEPGAGASRGGSVGLGRWLVENRECLDRGEAEWLERLAAFDREQLWALDGANSCSSWLMWRARMARSTSFERLRVAHEVFRRPIIADAFRAGVLSYSAVRIISRMDSPSADVDRALVELASTPDSSLADIERVVRAYGLYASQERLPADRARAKRGVQICRGENGSARIVITLSDLEVEEFAAALQAFIDLRYRTDQPVESLRVETRRTVPRVKTLWTSLRVETASRPQRWRHSTMCQAQKRRWSRRAGRLAQQTRSWTWLRPPFDLPTAAGRQATTDT